MYFFHEHTPENLKGAQDLKVHKSDIDEGDFTYNLKGLKPRILIKRCPLYPMRNTCNMFVVAVFGGRNFSLGSPFGPHDWV